MQPILPLQGRTSILSNAVSSHKVSQLCFQDFLQSAKKKELAESQDLIFSAHAQNRLQQRNINLNHEDLTRLQSAVDKLAQKGARESLIYMQDVALVVSVANRTVITALEKMQGKDNIITNIDSAAII
ncbi:MAG: flagellar biosynthesis protein [Selenomonas sp.]|uniref:TIGR02530 family flagellar biosynthesis protein n=1 Tax=Selenomonas sp. TaxID=2053611 RepID=UPI0025D56811|nr:TIGR02530 family flagellar biosynthesis protein [Selenomonas sp.]MCR5756494.1 flagellar biosynthesis protein [Selenomonas sp.]